MNSASLCSLGRYNNPIPPRFLASIDCLKIPAQDTKSGEIDYVESVPGLLTSLKIPSQLFFGLGGVPVPVPADH
jgi:hypothetical protein